MRRLYLWAAFGLLSIGIHLLTIWRNGVERELGPPGEDDDDEESGHGRMRR